MRRLAALLALCAALVAGHASAAHADGVPPPYVPAERLDLGALLAQQVAIADALIIDRGTPGDCASYHDLAIAAGWSEAQWPTLRTIMNRESRCIPTVVNRYGCVGLLQACRINHARLGVSAGDLKDPATNLAVGRTLCEEQVAARRSCFRPWWTRGFRP